MNITGGSDIKLFEVDAAVNKIRAEVDPEAELIFGAIKDENMNGKIRVSIVATSLKGSTIYHDTKPVLNIVNNLNGRNNLFTENLFSKSNIEKNIVNSIDGATALKLDENYEIKSDEEQNTLINSFESHEENKISEEALNSKVEIDEIPNGVSIESASYMESRVDSKTDEFQAQDATITREKSVEEHTPKLFSDERLQEDLSSEAPRDEKEDEQLFDEDVNEEEDFEIPAFLRRQKF